MRHLQLKGHRLVCGNDGESDSAPGYKQGVCPAGDCRMTLSELLPALHGLPRAEKLQAIQVLAADVAHQERGMTTASDAAHPIWSPYDAFEGAATLMRVLNEEQAE
jgi:hypothetical protein